MSRPDEMEAGNGGVPRLLAATVGKFGGTLVPARLTGLGWRESTALGLLMNTRGLMELIALNIGLDMKVISPPLFAMMVLMALATTMATSPLLHWLRPRYVFSAASSQADTSSLRSCSGSAGLTR